MPGDDANFDWLQVGVLKANKQCRVILWSRGLPAKYDNVVHLTRRAAWFAGKSRSNDFKSVHPPRNSAPDQYIPPPDALRKKSQLSVSARADHSGHITQPNVTTT